MNDNEKSIFTGTLRKRINISSHASPFKELTQITYFELDLIQMTLGYKKKQNDNSLNKVYGYKQVLSYSLNIKNEDKSICEWNHGFMIKFLGGKTYLLFCENINDLLMWMEGLRIFFERKSQKLFVKFNRNDSNLVKNDSSLINSNTKNDQKIYLLKKEIDYKKLQENTMKQEMFISHKFCFELLSNSRGRRNINHNISKEPINFRGVLEPIKTQNFNLICRYTENLEKRHYLFKYRAASQKQVISLYYKMLEKIKVDFIKQIYIISNRIDEFHKQKKKKPKQNMIMYDSEDWEVDTKQKEKSAPLKKDILKKEILKTKDISNTSSRLYQIKTIDQNDLSIPQLMDQELQKKKDLPNLDKSEKNIIPELLDQEVLVKKNIPKFYKSEKNINSFQVISPEWKTNEHNNNTIHERSPLESIKRDRINEYNEALASMENKINGSFENYEIPPKIVEEKKDPNTGMEPDQNENIKKEKIDERIPIEKEENELSDQKVNDKQGEDNSLNNDNKQDFGKDITIKPIRNSKLNLNLINTDDDLNFETEPRNINKSPDKINLVRSKSANKNIIKKDIPTNELKTKESQGNMKALNNSEESKQIETKSKPKPDLNISGISAKTFQTISSPHFGNISIIAQRFIKVDNIDDWKEYVHVNQGNKQKQRNDIK